MKSSVGSKQLTSKTIKNIKTVGLLLSIVELQVGGKGEQISQAIASGTILKLMKTKDTCRAQSRPNTTCNSLC